MHTRSKKKKKKSMVSWPLQAFLLTVALSLVLSFFSHTSLLGVPIPVAVGVLALIIVIGILFDSVGVAVAAQNTSDFAAMASKKIHGARRAIRLVQNADRVASICNDVVGDICGIISGAMGASIAARLIVSLSESILVNDMAQVMLSSALSALIAAMTVSGKAVGKKYALKNSRSIVFVTAKILSVFDR